MKKVCAVFVFILSFFLIALAGAQEEKVNKKGEAAVENPVQAETPNPAEPTTEKPPPAETIEPMAPEPVVPEAPAVSENVLIDDSIPEGAAAEGNWEWDDTLKFSGDKSHTEPAAKGLYGHSLKLASPLNIKANSKIIQYVYLDPQNPPKGIVLKFKLKTDEEVGVYWEGSEEAVTNMIGDEELLWYQDELPKTGEWVKLEIPASEAEIEDEDIKGISYFALDGKVNWDYTAIVEGAREEEKAKEE